VCVGHHLWQRACGRCAARLSEARCGQGLRRGRRSLWRTAQLHLPLLHGGRCTTAAHSMSRGGPRACLTASSSRSLGSDGCPLPRPRCACPPCAQRGGAEPPQHLCALPPAALARRTRESRTVRACSLHVWCLLRAVEPIKGRVHGEEAGRNIPGPDRVPGQAREVQPQ